jgi:hypothetical protein
MNLEITNVRHGSGRHRTLELSNGGSITINHNYDMRYEERNGDYILPDYPPFGRKISRRIEFHSEIYYDLSDETCLSIVQDRLDHDTKK